MDLAVPLRRICVFCGSWTQLGLHRKRCGLLNVAGFHDSLLGLFDRAVADGFLHRIE